MTFYGFWTLYNRAFFGHILAFWVLPTADMVFFGPAHLKVFVRKGLSIKSFKKQCTGRYFACLKSKTCKRLSGRPTASGFKRRIFSKSALTRVCVFSVLHRFLQLFKAKTSRNCLKISLFNGRDVFLGVFEFCDLRIDFELCYDLTRFIVFLLLSLFICFAYLVFFTSMLCIFLLYFSF